MRHKVVLALTTLLLAGPAWSLVELINKDGSALQCASTSTSSIQSNTTRDIGKGPCTVTVKGSSAKGVDGDTLVIKGGKVGKQ